MNKRLHRIIFNQARGVLMAVAECASSHSRGDAEPDAGQPHPGVSDRPSFNVHPIASALLVLLGCTIGFAPYAEAQIVGDPNAPRNQQATILNAGNGVPLVNIQTPSGAGVSRNTYSQFDVQANGAILNNSRGNAQTQLGGWVQGNPWLATGSARVILNEVNSANPSQLRGYVEVAGSRAQVVIANPAGVTCDGCGFINANRATLTTGTPIMNGGNLDGFRVERGQILIQGNGLDARLVDYTDLIARAITVNAGIWANTLKLIAGANQVDAEAGTVSPIAGSGPAPSFALDVGQLGGMYAGKIVMIGSEVGVGVKNAGQIGAAIGEISLTAEGRLINAGTISTTAQTLSFTTRGLDNSGTLSSQADIAITSLSEITNSGLINAGRELKLEIAGAIDNRGTLSGQRLDFSADRLANTGTIRQTGSQGLVLSAGNIVNSLGATLGHLTPGTIPNQSTSTSSTNLTTSTTTDAPSTAAGGSSVTSLPVTPEALADGRIALRGDLTNSGQLTANGRFDTSASRLDNRGMVNLDALTVSGDRLLNAGGTLIVTDLMARVTAFDNTAGQIKVARKLSINATDLINVQGSILHAGTSDLGIQVGAALNNTDGVLNSNANQLNLSAGSLNNTRGQITTKGALKVETSQGDLTNDAGLLSAERGLVATATGTISNHAGQVLNASPEALTLSAASLSNTLGKIQSNGTLQITAPVLANQGGTISAQGTLSLTASTALDNSANGLIASGGNLAVTAGSVNNTQGQIASTGGNLAITTTGQTLNTSGALQAAGTVTLANAGFSNTSGVVSGTTLELDTYGQSANNTGGLLLATQNLTLTTGQLNNDAGLIQSGGALLINTQGQTLSNRNASQFSNGQGGIISQGTLTVNSGNLDNTSGYLGALGTIDLTVSALTNTSGVILGSSSTRLNLASLDNTSGQIQSADTLTINATGPLTNTGGLLRSGTTLSAQASRIDNNQTTSNNQGIEGHDITLTTPILNNNSGAIRADHNLSFTSSGTFDNTNGLLSAGNLLSIQDPLALSTLAITNTGGRQIAGQKLDLKAASLTGDGQLLSLGDLSLTLTGNFTNSSQVRASHNLSLSTQGAFSNSGTLQAGNNLELSAATIYNQASGEISASGITHLTTGTLSNRGLIDGSDTRLDATTVNNLGSGRIYGDHLSIATINLNNLNENAISPTLAARTRLDLAVTGTLNNDLNALIFSGGNLAIGGTLDTNRQATGRGGVINNAGGTIQSLGTLSITAQQINNTNPNFSATVTAGPTVNQVTYLTSQGTITADQIAWQIDDQGWNGSTILDGNGSPNAVANTTLLLVKKDSPYANDAGYFGTNVYAGATTTQSCDSNGNCMMVPVPPTIATTYAAGDPIWSRFGVTPPASALPSASQPVAPVAPTATCDEYGTCTPPTPAQVSAWQAAYDAWQVADAAWQAAAAPYIALQNQLDNFRGNLNASSRLTVYSVINESYQPLVAQVLSSTPGQILSASTMTLDASQSLINDKSRIIAGGALNVFGQSIANIAAQVSGIESHTGTSAAWAYAGHDGKSTGHHCDCSFYAFKPAAYALDVLVTLNSPIALVQQYQAPGGGSAVPGQGGFTNVGTTSASGTVVNLSGGNTAPSALPGTHLATGSSSVALSVPVNLTVPATSLYLLHPGPGSGYLIETDPRFANYRSWLSSDYLLTALSYAPASVQKRLGDGFYEQQLIREQIALLTGQRFLQGYDNDEAQYRALMNHGATVAQAWQLRPGVALTASQIAQLTSDIVWLVEQTVTLPDGTTQQVLVPQVYVMPRSGDLKGDGTLLAGNSIHLAASGDLTNSGTVAGRSLVDLSAENIRNLGGQINGDQVSLKATNDLDNIGGRIEANRSLMLMAGRDVNVSSTTVSGSGQSTLGQTTGQFTATRLDRLAGLYVTGDRGLLTAIAGRDINLTAAEVSNTHGDSQLLAGRDLNLNTLTLSQQSDIRYSAGNTAKFGNSTEIGTTIKSGGSLALAAGNDINARATQIDAQGDLSLKAGNDINLSAGRNEQYIETSGHSETKSKKLFGGSKETKDFSLEAETQTAQISTLSGKNVSLETGNIGTLATQGSRITATEDLSVKAGTILLDAAYDGERSNSSSSIIGKTTQQKSEQSESLTATGSILSAGRNLSLESSGDTTVIGSALAAGQKATIKTGGNLALLAAESSSERQINDYNQTKKQATTLAFEQAEVRQLLSTITVGSGLNIEVGGNFTADIGERNPDGSLIADRMTVDGVVRGAARQQVDIKTTGVGANSNATSSQILGPLNTAGLRNGANDSFAPKAAITGGDALQQYLNSGLVQIQNNPQLADQLKHVLSNPGGASLTYKDDSGNISLTVAGQAKVQEVFNTLKLSESFDTKKLTDQGMAQIVTLVVAIVLTVCTAGAGAASLGAVAASAMGATATTAVTAATTAMVINAAIIGMSSTMIGQLAGGSSFDKAFQAGVKAGATSAVMAGVSAGIGEVVGSPPTTNIDAAGQTTQVGTNAAEQGLSKLQAMGTSQYWAQTGLNALAKGALASAQGGKFEDGVIGSVLGSLSASGAGIIGSETNGLGNILSHAVLGCAVAAAGKQDCASGALGGAASATLARVIDAGIGDGLDDATKRAVIAGGAVAGSAALVGALGGNVMTAGNAASNEVLNNFLSHSEASKREEAKQKLLACQGDACVQAQAEVNRLNELDAKRDAAIEQACKNPASLACQSWNSAIQVAKASYINYDPKADLTGSIAAERSHVNTKAYEYQQAAGNPLAYGVGKGLLKVTPLGLVAGAGAGAYELTTAILNNGATDTAIAIAKGVVDLPDQLRLRLDSADPAVRGEALVDALALGTVAAAVTGKLVQSGISVSKGGAIAVDAGNSTAKIDNNFYKEGAAANTDKTLSPGFGSKSGIELTATEANQLVQNSLPKNVTVVRTEAANDLNAVAIAGKEGYKPPYVPSSNAVTFTTQEPTQYVRVYTTQKDGSGQVGNWMFKAADIEGLSATQIASKYSLPQPPNMRVDVTVPAGQSVRASVANDIQIKQGIAGNGGGGGVQFEVRSQPEKFSDFEKWFSNPRQLP